MRRPSLLIALAVLAGFATIKIAAYATDGWAWATSTVPYYVNTANIEGLTSSAILSDLQKGADTWPTQAGVNIHLQYAGPTNSTTIALDHVNNVFFRNDAVSYYSTETFFWADASGHLVDFDMVWHEANYQFFTGNVGCQTTGQKTPQYIQDVAVHEFGHALGMLHSTVPTATMYPTVNDNCDLAWETLDPDDIAGIRSLYPLASSSPTQPPAAPSISVAVSSSNPTSTLQISWTESTSSVDGFRVERSTDGVNYAEIAQVSGSTKSYTNSGLSSGTKYYYRADAFNGAGTSSYSNVAAATTQSQTQSSTAPGTPSNPSPSNGATGTSTTPTLGWSSTGAQSYDVYFGTTSTPALFVSNLTSASVGTGTLAAGTTYYWRVNAKNSVGSTSGPIWSFTTKSATTQTKGKGRKGK